MWWWRTASNCMGVFFSVMSAKNGSKSIYLSLSLLLFLSLASLIEHTSFLGMFNGPHTQWSMGHQPRPRPTHTMYPRMFMVNWLMLHSDYAAVDYRPYSVKCPGHASHTHTPNTMLFIISMPQLGRSWGRALLIQNAAWRKFLLRSRFDFVGLFFFLIWHLAGRTARHDDESIHKIHFRERVRARACLR